MVILNRKQSLNRRICSQSIDGNSSSSSGGSSRSTSKQKCKLHCCLFLPFFSISLCLASLFHEFVCISYHISHLLLICSQTHAFGVCVCFILYNTIRYVCTLELLMPLLLFYISWCLSLIHSFRHKSVCECSRAFFLSILSRLSKQTFSFC